MMKTVNDMTSHVINPQVAVAAAVLYGNLRDREALSADVSLADGLYEVLLHSEWMDYDCYVDAATGEVLGLQSAPVEACRLGA